MSELAFGTDDFHVAMMGYFDLLSGVRDQFEEKFSELGGDDGTADWAHFLVGYEAPHERLLNDHAYLDKCYQLWLDAGCPGLNSAFRRGKRQKVGPKRKSTSRALKEPHSADHYSTLLNQLERLDKRSKKRKRVRNH